MRLRVENIDGTLTVTDADSGEPVDGVEYAELRFGNRCESPLLVICLDPCQHEVIGEAEVRIRPLPSTVAG